MDDFVQFHFLEAEKGSLCAEWTVNRDLPYFNGHFPGDPILPAVSIIDISLFLLAKSIPENPSHSLVVKRSKFMGMIRPDQKVHIVAESVDGDGWKVLWLDFNNKNKLAQIHLVFH